MAWTPLGGKSLGGQPTKVTSYGEKDLIAIINEKIELEISNSRMYKLYELRVSELEEEQIILKNELEELKKLINKR